MAPALVAAYEVRQRVLFCATAARRPAYEQQVGLTGIVYLTGDEVPAASAL